MEVVVLVGLQGSGKSTFYRTFYADTHVLVSKDRFRNHRRPQLRQERLIEGALREGRSVVVDNTNPTAADRARIIALARSHGAETVAFFFESRIDDCLARNSRRLGKERVPEKALFITLSRLCAPASAEGFDRLYRVTLDPSGGFVVRDHGGEGTG